MEISALRQFVSDHPEGVVIRMVDGKEYTIPHRDYIWFTPGYGQPESRVGRYATSFYVSEDGTGRLVNALLVAEVLPLKKASNGQGPSGQSKKRN